MQFALICFGISILAVLDLRSRRHARLSPRKQLYNRLVQARHEGTLGKPRLKTFRGEWYVIGCGRRYLVTTKAEGYRLMAKMRREMNKTLEALPAKERKKHIIVL